jgi:hypothetical protein
MKIETSQGVNVHDLHTFLSDVICHTFNGLR